MEIEGPKQVINLIMSLFLRLLTNNHCLEELFNKLHIYSTFTNVLLPFHEVHSVDGPP